MLCPIGQDLSEEVRAAGLDLSTAEADRDKTAADTARKRRQNAVSALDAHRESCNSCSKKAIREQPEAP
jgi:hypothetical protein